MITDYAWDDDEKKVNVYVEFDKLDEVPDEFMDVELANGRQVVFTVLSHEGLRLLSLNTLFGEVKRVKHVRKRGKNRVILKLFKAAEGKWPRLTDSMQSGFKGGLHEEALGHPTSTHNMGVDLTKADEESSHPASAHDRPASPDERPHLGTSRPSSSPKARRRSRTPTTPSRASRSQRRTASTDAPPSTPRVAVVAPCPGPPPRMWWSLQHELKPTAAFLADSRHRMKTPSVGAS